MNLKMNYNSFIKLKDFFKIQDISAEIEEYEVNDVNIEGQLSIKGKYLRRDNISEEYFLEKIPFSILMPNSDFEIEDILNILQTIIQENDITSNRNKTERKTAPWQEKPTTTKA